MARATSKLQVTVPKTIAEQFAIRPGDEIDWIPAGDGIRVVRVVERKQIAETGERAERPIVLDLQIVRVSRSDRPDT